MLRTMLKSKIHRATLTGTELNYQGSITLDPLLLEAADLLVGEQVQVLNVNTGARFITYTIKGRKGSGQCMLNGPAARLGQVGDEVMVLSYSQVDDAEARKKKAVVVHVDKRNRIRKVVRK